MNRKFITKQVNQNLIDETNNIGESFRMKATKIGKDTVLTNIIKTVKDVQSQKPKLLRLIQFVLIKQER